MVQEDLELRVAPQLPSARIDGTSNHAQPLLILSLPVLAVPAAHSNCCLGHINAVCHEVAPVFTLPYVLSQGTEPVSNSDSDPDNGAHLQNEGTFWSLGAGFGVLRMLSKSSLPSCTPAPG